VGDWFSSEIFRKMQSRRVFEGGKGKRGKKKKKEGKRGGKKVKTKK